METPQQTNSPLTILGTVPDWVVKNKDFGAYDMHIISILDAYRKN